MSNRDVQDRQGHPWLKTRQNKAADAVNTSCDWTYRDSFQDGEFLNKMYKREDKSSGEELYSVLAILITFCIHAFTES